ncbi:MAG: hypothetical protein JOS17DRAFT_305803 [Linnemannia elongata]|nr:MAG: hypothetical protein JOS17DRAFT_305803 [Linnemannia elongata]
MNIGEGTIPLSGNAIVRVEDGVEWGGRGDGEKAECNQIDAHFFFPSFLFLLLSSLLSCIHPSSLRLFILPPFCLSSPSTFIVFFFQPLLHIDITSSPSRTPSTNSTHTTVGIRLSVFLPLLSSPLWNYFIDSAFLCRRYSTLFDLLSNTSHIYTYSLLILALTPVSL